MKDEALPDEDAALWAKFTGGDEAAFERLYERLGPESLTWIRRAFHLQEADAANLTQYVFLCLYARRDDLGYDSARARFRTWFRSFVRFRAVDELRRQRRQFAEASFEGHEYAEGVLAARAEELARRQEEEEDQRERLLRCLERHDCLDEREKYVIRNGNDEGLGEMTQASMAAALHLSPGQVSKIKQSAIRKLARCVSDVGT